LHGYLGGRAGGCRFVRVIGVLIFSNARTRKFMC
jgi:hypothetical protein